MYKFKQTSIEQRAKDAKAFKKALEPKELVPKENEEDFSDPDAIELELEDPSEDFLNEYNEDYQQKKRNKIAEKSQEILDKYKNPFPLDIFPKSIKEYILDAERCLKAPCEYTAAGILSSLAGAIGNKFHVSFKEGWQDPVSLYLVLIGPTGANKSTPLKSALRPLFDKEKVYTKEYQKALNLYNKKLNNKESEDLEPPIYRRCIVNDITMESLADVLQYNAVTACHDEFAGFLKSMNKYRKGDDLQKWLSFWSGELTSIDRKGKTSLIINPFVNLVGTIQPDVLLDFIKGNDSGNGFNERLLYVTTERNINLVWNDMDINISLAKSYHDIINLILDIEQQYTAEGDINPLVIGFNNEAKATVLEWQKCNSRLCNNTSDIELIGIYLKFQRYLIRFSLIMAIMDYANLSAKILKKGGFHIQSKHVKSAIEIIEFFRNSARSLYALKSSVLNYKAKNKRLMKFFDELPERFETPTAIKAGKKLGLSRRSIYYYLNDQLFKQINHAEYEKAYHYK